MRDYVNPYAWVYAGLIAMCLLVAGFMVYTTVPNIVSQKVDSMWQVGPGTSLDYCRRESHESR